MRPGWPLLERIPRQRPLPVRSAATGARVPQLPFLILHWKYQGRVARALAIGTALQIGVGLAGRYVASQAARQATKAAVSGVNGWTQRGLRAAGVFAMVRLSS